MQAKSRERKRARGFVVPLTGVEPAHMASEANALSAELQAHYIKIIPDSIEICKCLCYNNNEILLNE